VSPIHEVLDSFAKLRILSDGTAEKTKIFIGDTDISHIVQKVEWEIDSGGSMAVAILHISSLHQNHELVAGMQNVKKELHYDAVKSLAYGDSEIQGPTPDAPE
jgi:hypothetical protein